MKIVEQTRTLDTNPQISSYMQRFTKVLKQDFHFDCKKNRLSNSLQYYGNTTIRQLNNNIGDPYIISYELLQKLAGFQYFWNDLNVSWKLAPIQKQCQHSMKLSFLISDKNLIPFSLSNIGMKIVKKINQINLKYQRSKVLLMQDNRLGMSIEIASNFLAKKRQTIVAIIKDIFGEVKKVFINDIPSIFKLQKTHLNYLNHWYRSKKAKLNSNIRQLQMMVQIDSENSNQITQNTFQQAFQFYKLDKLDEINRKRQKEQIKIYTIKQQRLKKSQWVLEKFSKKKLLQLTMYIQATGTVNQIHQKKSQVPPFKDIKIFEKVPTNRQKTANLQAQIKMLASLSGRDKIIGMPKYFLKRGINQQFQTRIIVQMGETLVNTIDQLSKQNLLIQSLKYYKNCVQILIEFQNMSLIHRDFTLSNLVKLPENKIVAIDFQSMTQYRISNLPFYQDPNYVKLLNQLVQKSSMSILPHQFVQFVQVQEQNKKKKIKKGFRVEQFTLKNQQNVKKRLAELFHINFDIFAAGTILKDIIDFTKGKFKETLIPQNFNLIKLVFFKYLYKITEQCNKVGDLRPSAMQIYYVINQIIQCVQLIGKIQND